MLAKHGAGLPHGWMSGDDEMGRPYWFRRRLATLGERYWLAVPSNTALRDLETEPPSIGGRGVGPGLPGTALRPGVNRLVQRPGTESTCAMAVKVPWWLRPSKDV